MRTKKVIPITSSVSTRRITGRLLVQLDRKTPVGTIIRQARAKGQQLVSSQESMAVGLSQSLLQYDGVVFDRLHLAVINEKAALRMQRLLGRPQSAFLTGEPERYLRVAAGGRDRKGAYKNTTTATWGVHALNVAGIPLTGKGVRIAILDTGFDFMHPDFAGRTIHRKSFTGTRQAQDKEGHGTHITGIAGGGRKGKEGARYGVASGARLYVGKVLDDGGEGTDGQLLAGIEWALEKGCQLISMSFGAAVGEGETYSALFEQVARTAMENNCLLIAAAGNESERDRKRIGAINHPANCPSILAVGALTPFLEVAEYSCAGASPAGGQIEIAAPGDNILSAKPGGGYRRQSGTSMATAFVTGVAALLWEKYPRATAGEIWAKLVQHAWRLSLAASDVGAGLCTLPNYSYL